MPRESFCIHFNFFFKGWTVFYEMCVPFFLCWWMLEKLFSFEWHNLGAPSLMIPGHYCTPIYGRNKKKTFCPANAAAAFWHLISLFRPPCWSLDNSIFVTGVSCRYPCAVYLLYGVAPERFLPISHLIYRVNGSRPNRTWWSMRRSRGRENDNPKRWN